MPEPEDFVVCRICGNIYQQITHGHLNKQTCQKYQEKLGIHITSLKTYRTQFPNAPTISLLSSQKLSKSSTLYWQNISPEKRKEFGRANSKASPQRLKTRRKNDPEGKSYQRMVQTRIKRHGPCQVRNPEEVNKMRSQNMRSGGSERMVKTRREKYGAAWFSDPETARKNMSLSQKNPATNKRRILTRRKNDPHNEASNRARKTRHTNDPNNESYQKMLKTREKRHPNFLQNSLFKGSRKPNLSESKLIPILTPLGFKYNGKGPIKIAHHFPDFTHTKHQLLIEYDGPGGHDPEVPWIPRNAGELDDQRDRDYRKEGWEILRILPEDLKKGRIHIQQKVRKWIISLGYTTEWEIVDARELFE